MTHETMSVNPWQNVRCPKCNAEINSLRQDQENKKIIFTCMRGHNFEDERFSTERRCTHLNGNHCEKKDFNVGSAEGFECSYGLWSCYQ